MNKTINLRKDITVFTSALYQTNSVVMRGAEAVFVIDPCWLPQEIEAIKEHVGQIRGERKLYLIFTHSDYDHIIGYGAFPGAKVIASQAFANKQNKAPDVDQAKTWDDEHYISRPYKIEYPHTDIVIDRDGKALHFDGTVLTFYFAPGHTAEGMYIIWEPAGLFVAGDYLSDVEFPFIEDGIENYRHTMNKVDRILNAHQIRWMVPGHGSVAYDIDDIKDRRDASLEYIGDLIAHKNGSDFLSDKYASRYEYWEGLRTIHEQQVKTNTQDQDDSER